MCKRTISPQCHIQLKYYYIWESSWNEISVIFSQRIRLLSITLLLESPIIFLLIKLHYKQNHLVAHQLYKQATLECSQQQVAYSGNSQWRISFRILLLWKGAEILFTHNQPVCLDSHNQSVSTRAQPMVQPQR